MLNKLNRSTVLNKFYKIISIALLLYVFAFNICIFAITLPDLTGTAVIGSSYTAGQTGVQIPVTVNRTGGALTAGTYVDARLYWSTNYTWDVNDTQLWEANKGVGTLDFPNTTLNSNGTKTVTATINIPNATAGTYYIILVTDPNLYHSESNENNNITVYSRNIQSIPNTPTGLTLTQITGGFRISWNNVSGAGGPTPYKIYWGNDNSVSETNYAGIINDDGTPSDHTGLVNGYTYYYRIKACNSSGSSALSSTVSQLYQVLPNTPTGLTLTQITGGFRISWDNVSGAGGATPYKIYWGNDNSVGETNYAGIINDDGTPSDHTGLVSGYTYYYRIKACNSSGNSALSSTVSQLYQVAATKPVLNIPEPDAIITSDIIGFSWDEFTNAVYYKILVDNNSGFGSPEVFESTALNSYIINKNYLLQNVYYWKIQAIKSNGDMVESDPWSFTYTPPIAETPIFVPMYRLYHSSYTDHFYTSNKGERDTNIGQGYKYEKIEFYVSFRNFEGGTPLFRLFNQDSTAHYYTASDSDRDAKINDGYTYEGIAGFVYANSNEDSMPLFSLTLDNGSKYDNFFTISKFERDNAVSKYGYQYKGIVAYVSPNGIINPLSKNKFTGSVENVNTSSGNFTFQPQKPAFVLSATTLPLIFNIIYNSNNSYYNERLGYGWTHSYNITLYDADDIVEILWDDGHEEIMKKENDSTYVSMYKDSYNKLILAPDSTFVLTLKNQTKYIFKQRIQTLNSGFSEVLWKATSIIDKNNNKISVDYSDYNGDLKIAAIKDSTPDISNIRQLSFSYNGAGYIERINDSKNNRYIEFQYDSAGNLKSYWDPERNVTQFFYEDIREGNENLLTKIILSELNTFRRVEYDSLQQVINQFDALGNKITFNYHNPGNQTTISKPDETIVHYYDDPLRKYNLTKDENYNSLGQKETSSQYKYLDSTNNPFLPTIIIDGRGDTTKLEYDTCGNMTKIIDPLFNSTMLTYDDKNNPRKKIEPLNRVTDFGYDIKGNLTQIKVNNSVFRTLSYNSYGLLQQIINARSDSTNFSYNLYGNLEKIGNARLDSTLINYDDASRIVSTTDLNGNTIQYTYDKNDNLKTVSDPRNQAWKEIYDYDKNNNLKSIQDKRSNTTQFEYYLNDWLKFVKDPYLKNIEYRYDSVGNLSELIDKRTNSTNYKYNSYNQVTEITDALQQKIKYAYDSAGNKIQEIDQNNKTTYFEYDELNRIKTVTDPAGDKIENFYDELGRLIKVRDGNGNEIKYGYNAFDKMTYTIDANGDSTGYVYDEEQNLKEIHNAKNKVKYFSYDKLNRLETETDFQNRVYTYKYDANGNMIEKKDPNNQTITYEYYQNNQLKKVKYPDNSFVEFQYDENGNRTSMTDKLGSSSFSYDFLNRLKDNVDCYGKTVVYNYDDNNNLKQLTYPGSKIVLYQYDEINRLKQVTDWLSNTTIYNYNSTGLIKSVNLPNGITTNYNYDNAQKLTSLDNKRPNASYINQYIYSYDSAGNITGEERNEPITPAYTAQDINYSYGDDNQLTAMNAQGFTYDNNGNLNARNGIATYNFDYENMLTGVTKGSDNYAYNYSGLGHRKSKSINGNITKYVHDIHGDMENILTDTDNNGNIQNYYIYGMGLIAKITPSGDVYYYHSDSRGSTIAITDKNANIVNSYAYDEFGNVLAKNETTSNPFRFVGRYGVMDEDNGLTFMRARYYDAELGRFVSKDPIEGKDYLYVANAPINYIDFKGLKESSSVEGLKKVLQWVLYFKEKIPEKVIEPTVGAIFSNPNCGKAAVSFPSLPPSKILLITEKEKIEGEKATSKCLNESIRFGESGIPNSQYQKVMKTIDKISEKGRQVISSGLSKVVKIFLNKIPKVQKYNENK